LNQDLPSYRFGKFRRLTDKAGYKRVFGRSRRYTDDCFTVLIHEDHQAGPRLGLAIAKKTIKTAVARNRIKRIIRESFRTHADQIGSNDIVVMARRGADNKTNKELHAALDRCWSRLVKQ
jgi:ribonuclease P protein component